MCYGWHLSIGHNRRFEFPGDRIPMANKHDIRRFSESRGLRFERVELRLVLDATIAGHVYIDSNDDGTRDTDEVGVPGVVIYLSGIDTDGDSVNRSMLTMSDGSFQFEIERPGTYQLRERQPSSLLDGQDSSSVPDASVQNDVVTNLVVSDDTVSDDTVLNGNDFGERLLRAEFIGIGWFFASAPSTDLMLRECVAIGEEHEGETELAESIRAGQSEIPIDANELPPVARADNYSVNRDAVLTVSASDGVLANDTDADSELLTAILQTQPNHGTVDFDVNGTFIYTPDTGFVGTDSFTYDASDGDYSATATVTINVVGNVAPQSMADAYTVTLGEVLTVTPAQGVLANDSDSDEDTLTAVLVGQPTNGQLVLNANGSFTYDPDDGFVGSDSFTYRANDGVSESNLSTVTLQVNLSNEAVPDFTLADVNPKSATEGVGLSPRDYLRQVSGWYFGHST